MRRSRVSDRCSRRNEIATSSRLVPTDDRGERFLAAFRALESHLHQELGVGQETTFVALVRNGKSSNRLVRQYAEDLIEFAELRNAITHRRNDALLAQPTEAATTELEHIVETFKNPPRIDSALTAAKVTCCQPSSRIRDAAALMRAGNFSQLPVYNRDRFVALLTAETIARWVSAELERHDGMLEDAVVEEALPHVEDPENHAFQARTATIFETLDLFNNFSLRGKTLDAIIITNDGRMTAPLGIVTIYDVPRLLQRIPGSANRLLT